MNVYSTISEDGIIIDCSDFTSIQHDRERRQAILNGSISTKAVAVALAKDGFCTSKRYLTGIPQCVAVVADKMTSLAFGEPGCGHSFLSQWRQLTPCL